MEVNLKAGFFRLAVALSAIGAIVGFLIGASQYGYPEEGILPAVLLAACIWGVYLLVRYVVYGFHNKEPAQQDKPKG